MHNIISTAEVEAALRPEWRIREATARDAEALLAYLYRIASEPDNNTGFRAGTLPSLEALRAEIRQHALAINSRLLIAAHGDQIIGMVRLTGGDSAFTAHQAVLSINIHPDYRGMRLGSILMRRALKWARAAGVLRRIELEALTRNRDAVRLYRRHGFVIEGRRRLAYYVADEGVYVDVYLMGLYL
jgi:RimJ/RimL family protein N-acetyltransferase